MTIALTEKNLLSEYADLIPSEPFMAIIGTSHTVGECDTGFVSNTYGEILAKQLGLKYLNLGYSGAFNDDLLDITITAINSGLLDNCKLALVEGRLGTTIKKISRVPVQSYSDSFFRDPHNHGSSSIVNTKQFMHTAGNYQNQAATLHTINGHADMTLDELSKAFEYSSNQIPELQSYAIYKLNEYIKSKIYYESHTPMDVQNDMLLIRAMCNLLSSKGIETYWFNVGGFPVKTSFINELYSQNILFKDKTDFDYNYAVYVDKNLSMQTELIKRHGQIAFNANLCKCNHGNQTMQYWMANLLMERLNAARNN